MKTKKTKRPKKKPVNLEKMARWCVSYVYADRPSKKLTGSVNRDRAVALLDMVKEMLCDDLDFEAAGRVREVRDYVKGKEDAK